MTDSRGRHLRLGPAPYVTEAQVTAATEAIKRLTPSRTADGRHDLVGLSRVNPGQERADLGDDLRVVRARDEVGFEAVAVRWILPARSERLREGNDGRPSERICFALARARSVRVMARWPSRAGLVCPSSARWIACLATSTANGRSGAGCSIGAPAAPSSCLTSASADRRACASRIVPACPRRSFHLTGSRLCPRDRRQRPGREVALRRRLGEHSGETGDRRVRIPRAHRRHRIRERIAGHRIRERIAGWRTNAERRVLPACGLRRTRIPLFDGLKESFFHLFVLDLLDQLPGSLDRRLVLPVPMELSLRAQSRQAGRLPGGETRCGPRHHFRAGGGSGIKGIATAYAPLRGASSSRAAVHARLSVERASSSSPTRA